MNSHQREPGAPALSRGLRILALFTPERRQWVVRDLANELGAPLASVYRLTKTLEAHGFLERRAGGALVLGLALTRLGSVALSGLDLRGEAIPVLRELSERTGDTALLMVARGGEAVCLDKVEGSYPMRPRSFMVGERVPLDSGATPLALLAFLSAAEFEAVLADADPSRTGNRHALQVRCDAIRSMGYAYSHDEVVRDTAAIAAPIFGFESASAVAAIGLTGITKRIVGREAVVIEAAHTLSRRLGSESSEQPGDLDEERS